MASRQGVEHPAVPLTIVSIVVLAAGTVWGAAGLAHTFEHSPAPQRNPLDTLIRTASGRFAWTSAATTWLVVEAVVVALLIATATGLWFRRPSRTRARFDTASALLPVDDISLARYLGNHPVPGLYNGPGVPLGNLLRRGKPTKKVVQMTWEDVGIVFGGPRMGKTVSIVVPAIAAAPGACIVTSNKADVFDYTAGLRAESGKVWLFDPQEIASAQPPAWWWNPLAAVNGLGDAEQLATIWADVGKPKDARQDAYFEPRGRTLLAAMILAGAVGNNPLTDVAYWLKNPFDTKPSNILRTTYPAVADTIDSQRTLPEKTRAGVYDTALKAVGWLDNPLISRWVTDPKHARPQFQPADFVRSTDTVYLLSREGNGSAAPLVTAFAAALLTDAERYGQESGGRLPTPLLAVLDEAANVCRWKDLPDLYSHYGSRSIAVVTVLQNPSQGEEVWGEHGLEKLWAASNTRLWMGGIPEPRWLQRISTLCGDYEAPHRSTTTGSSGSGRSHTYATHREPIFPVSLLSSLGAGRAVAILSATEPVALQTVPYRTTSLGRRIDAANERDQQEQGAIV